MSTYYAPSQKILAKDLLDGRLDQFGIRERIEGEGYKSSDDGKCLTDGSNFLWICIDEHGFVSQLTVYAWCGAVVRILSAISEAFETDIFSEHEPQYWGFDTQDEWDEWQRAIAEHENAFYADILKFAAGEPNGIRQGTIGECQALIGKKLIADDAGLAASERRAELIQKITTIYDRDYVDHVTPPF